MRGFILLNEVYGFLSELLIRGNSTPLVYGFIIALSVALIIPVVIIVCLAVSINKELKKRKERLSDNANVESETVEERESLAEVDTENGETNDDNSVDQNTPQELNTSVDEPIEVDDSFFEHDECEDTIELNKESNEKSPTFAEVDEKQKDAPIESIEEKGSEPFSEEEEESLESSPIDHIENALEEPSFAEVEEGEIGFVENIAESGDDLPVFAESEEDLSSNAVDFIEDSCEKPIFEEVQDSPVIPDIKDSTVEEPTFAEVGEQEEEIPIKAIEENFIDEPLFEEKVEEIQNSAPIEHIDELEENTPLFADVSEDSSIPITNIDMPCEGEPVFAVEAEGTLSPIEEIKEPIEDLPIFAEGEEQAVFVDRIEETIVEAPSFAEIKDEESTPIQNIDDVSIDVPIFAEDEEKDIPPIGNLREIPVEAPYFAESEEKESAPIAAIEEPIQEEPVFALSDNATCTPLTSIAEPATETPAFAEMTEEDKPLDRIDEERVRSKKGQSIDADGKKNGGKSFDDAPDFIGVEEDVRHSSSLKKIPDIPAANYASSQISVEEPVDFAFEESANVIPKEIEELPIACSLEEPPEFAIQEEKEQSYVPKKISERSIRDETPSFAEDKGEINCDIPEVFAPLGDIPESHAPIPQEKEVNRAIPKGLYVDVPDERDVEEKEEKEPSVRPEDIRPELTEEERAEVDQNEALLKSLMESEEEEIRDEIIGDEDIPVVIIGECTDTSNFTAFEHKLLNATNVQKYIFSEIKNTLLSYKHVRDKLSNAGDAFRQGSNLIARITLNGGKLRLHLCLNPKAYSPKVYKHYSLKNVAAYAEVPFTIELANRRDLVNACKLIQDAMASKFIIYTNDKREYIDYAAFYTMKESE